MQKKLPMFYKSMCRGFRTRLRLPAIMSEKLVMVVKEERRRGVKLISRKGMSDVDILKSENGGFSFIRGWKQFVDAHNLQLRDFLVFEDMGNLIFKVTLFDSTRCEKDFQVEQETRRKRAIRDEENVARRQNLKAKKTRLKNQKKSGNKGRLLPESVGDTATKCQFSLAMKHYNILRNRPYLYLPSAFCKANGLPKKARVTLKGPSGGLTVYERYHDGYIHRGWSGFLANAFFFNNQ